MSTTHASKRALAALSTAVVLASSAALADPPPPDAPRSIYRFDVSVTGVEEGPRAAPATYTLILRENQMGSASTGANIALGAAGGAGPAPRQDVGLSLRFTYTLRGEVALLTGYVELSSVEPASGGGAVTLHRVHVDGVAPVTPGTPALLGSVYDLSTRRRYEVTVTARRLM